MSRTRRVMRGLGVSYASQAILAVVGLWATRFLLGRLGQEQYGLWLVASQLIAYLTLTDLGIVAMVPREVAVATGQADDARDVKPLPEIVSQTVQIVFWQLPLVAVVAVALWIFLPGDWEAARGPLGLMVVAYLVSFPLRIAPAALSGLQDHAFVGGLGAAAVLSGTAVTVGLVVAGLGLTSLAAGWAVTQGIQTVGGLWRLWSRFPDALPRRYLRLTRAALKARFGRSLWVFWSQVAVTLLNATDTVIIGKVLGAAAVVPYACTAKLIQFLAGQPQLLMQMAQPGLAELRTREAPARVLQAASALTQAVLIGAGAIACGVVVVNYGFVRLWVGEAQWGGYGLMLLILLRMLLANWNLATGSAIYAFGYQRRLALVGIADGILYVAITGALVRTLGPSGAPLAGILTVVALQLPFNLHALARETGVTTLGLAWSLWPWAWRFAVAFAFATALGRIWRPTGIVELAVAGSVAVAAYGLLMVRRVQQPPVSRYLHPQVHSLLRRLPRALRAPGA